MLLAADRILETARTEETKAADLDALCDIVQQSLQVDKTVDIENRESMFDTHVVQISLDAGREFVAE